MIKYNPKSWFELIFHSYSGYVFKNLVPAQIFLAIYTAVVVYLEKDYFQVTLLSTTAVHSLLGIVLGLFLVFRTNSAYDRWWEGRKIWGNLVNNSRNLAMKINAALPQGDIENRRFYMTMIPNFAFTLKEHLRRVAEYQDLEFVSSDLEDNYKEAAHKPNYITRKLFDRTNELKEEQLIDGYQFLDLQSNIGSLVDTTGACERILNTPIPYSYSMFMKKFVFLFLITLPFGFIGEFGYWTIAIVLLITYILLGTELIAEEIEDPFGRDVNDLPTDALSEKIQNDINQIFKESTPELEVVDNTGT